MDTIKMAFVFPGQGSQAVGMGKELQESFMEAKEVFQRVDNALGQKLTTTMFLGPPETLTSTENAQPALMAVSLAIMAVLERKFNFKTTAKVQFMAGHSLGEYSALAASGVFDIETVAKLLKVRGTAMESSSPAGFGAMAAIIGIIDFKKIEELIQATKIVNEVCVIANDNTQGQIVISGNTKSINNAIARAKEFGAKMVFKLPVGGSFHSPLMQKAAETVAEALNKVELNNPNIPIISNVTAEAIEDINSIKPLLVEQITSRVRWRESLLYLEKAGVNTVVEVGQGNVLVGLVKRTLPAVTTVNLQSPQDIEDFIKKFN